MDRFHKIVVPLEQEIYSESFTIVTVAFTTAVTTIIEIRGTDHTALQIEQMWYAQGSILSPGNRDHGSPYLSVRRTLVVSFGAKEKSLEVIPTEDTIEFLQKRKPEYKRY